MRIEERDRLVRSIYDAALDPSLWPQMLTLVARAMNCEQCNFVLADPNCGATQVITPMWREDDRASFFAHWQNEFTIAPRLRQFSVGQIVDYEEIFDVDWLRGTGFYNEWWLPQGVGGGSLAANLVNDGVANVSITVHAAAGKSGFSSGERALFREIIGHLGKSVAILRRLQMAQLVTSKAESEMASGFSIVDQGARILYADPQTFSWLESLRLVESGPGMSRISAGPVKTLLMKAISSGSGGHLDVLDDDGGLVKVSAIPCSQTENFDPVMIDRPAALIWLLSADQIRRERMKRFAAIHSLTEAEAKIAMQACAGFARNEIAERCGISPHTVRTHLEAIYAKTGVHRQAELVRCFDTI